MTPTLSPSVLAIFHQAAQVLKPPPKLTVTEWAERYRKLSTESSAEPGLYRSSRAPYQRGMMDAASDPASREVVYFTSAQIGKSLCQENIFGYFAAEDPCPVIWMWPTDKVAKEWAIDTFTPLIRDTEALARLFPEGSRKSGNQVQAKHFPGGSLAIIGANAAANLRRRRARVLICDEVDGYKASVDDEGDPISLVAKRSVTFWNSLRILASTCTIKGESRIEAAYENTDRNKYWVPCPHCSEATGHLDGYQILRWENLVLDKIAPHEGTVYACEHCGVELVELDKPWMLRHGEWRAERPEIVDRRGFWINELYSPFVKWSEMAATHGHAMAHRENPELLKAFYNLALARTWQEDADDLDQNELLKRCEDYARTRAGELVLPDGVVVVTMGVDVQKDRIEAEVVGWGLRFESWSLARKRFEGDTTQPAVWDELEKYIDEQRFLHSRGVRLEIARTFVDSGDNTDTVYKFCKPRGLLGIYASKGASNYYADPVSKPSLRNRMRLKLYVIGVGQLKKIIYARLGLSTHGSGYCHFERSINDADYFDQLTAEQLKKDYKHGFPRPYWHKPDGRRNEALDCRVYAYAALLSMSEQPDKMIERLRTGLLDRARTEKAEREAKVGRDQLALIPDDDEIVAPAATPAPVADPVPVVAGNPPLENPPADPPVENQPDEQPQDQPQNQPSFVPRRNWVTSW